MKFAFICPRSFLWRYESGVNKEAVHMMLPSQFAYEKYANFYRHAALQDP